MKQTLLFLCLIASLAIFASFSASSNPTGAKVKSVAGFYIFTDSEPTEKYEYLGEVKSSGAGGFAGSQYEQVRDRLIKKARKEYPRANGLILHLNYGRADKADVILFEE